MDHLLTLLRAAAEDTRLRILALAAREDLTVSDYVPVSYTHLTLPTILRV